MTEVSRAAVTYVVNVTNTGPIDADDVVLGFISPPGAGSTGLPLKSLFGFERVHVPAGETVSVWLSPSLSSLAAVGVDGRHRVLRGRHQVSFGLAETRALGMGHAIANLDAV